MSYSNQEILELLQLAQVRSYYVNEVITHDNLINLSFTLTTDIGTFIGEDIDYLDSNYEKLISVFRPGFDNVLKGLLVKTLELYLDEDYCTVTYQPSRPERYSCKEHLSDDLIMNADMSLCQNCECKVISGEINYCDKCSLTLQLCFFCGQK